MLNNTNLKLRQQLANDIHRPRYHFLPPNNWMNDPNGVIQWNGKYHLFFQHNPYGPLWGNMNWGHAISEDLIHWKDLPLALIPDSGSYDEAGCFSGCCVDNDGVPTIVYTATTGERNDKQVQAIATSQDALLTWEKHPANPVIDAVPAEAGQARDFRDPYVWREDDIWYMVLGSRIVTDAGEKGVVFLYQSSNLTDWEYLNPLITGEDEKHGAIWECPNFFKLDDKWVLIISAHQGHTTDSVYYFVGEFENHRFTPETSGVLDFGDLYAPLTFIDDNNRRLLFGWLREARSEVDQRLAGWSGAQAIPRILTLDDQHRLIMQPIPELNSIRGQQLSIDSMPVTQPKTLDVTGLHLDIECEFRLDNDGTIGLSVACAEDGSEKTDIIYDAKRSRLSVHKHFPRTNGAMTTHSREVPHFLTADETLQLRILLDGSVLEIIANGRTSLSRRIYPTSPNSNQVILFGDRASVVSVNIWEMPSIWQ